MYERLSKEGNHLLRCFFVDDGSEGPEYVAHLHD